MITYLNGNYTIKKVSAYFVTEHNCPYWRRKCWQCYSFLDVLLRIRTLSWRIYICTCIYGIPNLYYVIFVLQTKKFFLINTKDDITCWTRINVCRFAQSMLTQRIITKFGNLCLEVCMSVVCNELLKSHSQYCKYFSLTWHSSFQKRNKTVIYLNIKNQLIDFTYFAVSHIK